MSRRALILAERSETGITDASYELLEAASRLAERAGRGERRPSGR